MSRPMARACAVIALTLAIAACGHGADARPRARRAPAPAKASAPHSSTDNPAATPPKPMTTQELARHALRSVVHLVIRDASGTPTVEGSGFVVGENLIATNIHVIEHAHAVSAAFQKGRITEVRGVIAMDDARDIAILYADTVDIPPLPLVRDSSGEQVGDAVLAVGNPEGLEGSISTGVISAIRMMDQTKVIQTTAPISHGSSGGPLLDSFGRVVGITSMFLDGGQNLNFAIASAYVAKLLPGKFVTYLSWAELERADAEAAPPAQTTGAATSQPAPPPAATPPPTQVEAPVTDKPLAGLKGVAVVVDDIDPSAQSEGVYKFELKTQIELRLRKAGITVYDRPDDEKNESGATLTFVLSTVHSLSGMYAYTERLVVREVVGLVRASPSRTFASVWSAGYVGYVNRERLNDTVHHDADAIADEFINKYLAQNSK